MLGKANLDIYGMWTKRNGKNSTCVIGQNFNTINNIPLKSLHQLSMNKILLTLTFVLFFFSTQAQPQNQQIEIHQLIHRVDSLQHELSYLQLNYELNQLRSDLSLFANDISTKSIEVQLYIYNRNFDARLADVYKNNYESYQLLQKSQAEKIESLKALFILKVITSDYSESELNVLRAAYDTIDKAYNTVVASMNTLKVAIDFYSDCI